MKTVFAFALLSIAQQASALEAPIAGYGVEGFEWDVETPNGIDSVKGSLEDFLIEQSKYPELAEKLFTASATDSELEKRTDFSNARTICGNFPETTALYTNGGIEHLRGLSGTPRNGPGPGNCGRVSCDEGAAIWWCNDSTSAKTLASFGSIADGARAIVDRCQHGVPDKFGYAVSGQVFHPTEWNVIVRKDKC